MLARIVGLWCWPVLLAGGTSQWRSAVSAKPRVIKNAFKHSDIQTLRNSNTQTLRKSDTQTLRYSDTQTLRHSDTQTFRHPDTQTLRHEGGHTTDLWRAQVAGQYSWPVVLASKTILLASGVGQNCCLVILASIAGR
jgi:hypothetical protein